MKSSAHPQFIKHMKGWALRAHILSDPCTQFGIWPLGCQCFPRILPTPLSLPPHFQSISTSCDSIFSLLYSYSIQATGPLSQPLQSLPIGLPASASVPPTVCPQYSPKPNQVAPAHSEQSPKSFPHPTRLLPAAFPHSTQASLALQLPAGQAHLPRSCLASLSPLPSDLC